MPPTLTGTLNMLTATIDWRDEVARCVGVFRSDHAAAVEVEYKVHLDSAMLDLLAKAFLKAGVPVLRGSAAEVPAVTLAGDTLAEYVPARTRYAPIFTESGEKIDRRTKAWRDVQRAADLQRAAGSNGNGDQS